MTTKRQIIERAKTVSLKQYFKENLNKSFKDIYFSEHFLFRIVDRKLENDKFLLLQMIDYFYQQVFLHTSQIERTYMLRFANIRMPIKITTGTISQKRIIVIKSVFDTDEEFYCDEIIELQSNYKKWY